jgi:hypothetical protein
MQWNGNSMQNYRKIVSMYCFPSSEVPIRGCWCISRLLYIDICDVFPTGGSPLQTPAGDGSMDTPVQSPTRLDQVVGTNKLDWIITCYETCVINTILNANINVVTSNELIVTYNRLSIILGYSILIIYFILHSRLSLKRNSNLRNELPTH